MSKIEQFEALKTNVAIVPLQVIVQNFYDQKKDVSLFYGLGEGVSPSAAHKLIQALKKLDIDEKDTRCIKNLKHGEHLRRSPTRLRTLASIVQHILGEHYQKTLDDTSRGVKVNGVWINNIRYADDTVLIADNINDLQHLLNIIEKTAKKIT